jgi:hypothetical protein
MKLIQKLETQTKKELAIRELACGDRDLERKLLREYYKRNSSPPRTLSKGPSQSLRRKKESSMQISAQGSNVVEETESRLF